MTDVMLLFYHDKKVYIAHVFFCMQWAWKLISLLSKNEVYCQPLNPDTMCTPNKAQSTHTGMKPLEKHSDLCTNFSWARKMDIRMD